MASREYEIAFQLIGELDNSVRKSFDLVEDQIKAVQEQMEELRRAGGLDDLADQAKKAGGAFGGLRRGMSGFGEAVGKVAKFMGAFAVVDSVVGSFQNVIGTLDDYQKSINQIQASTGATAAEMVEFRDLAKGIYANNIGEDFNDIADALSNVRRTTKLTGAELQRATENAIVMRDTFGFDITESVKTADTMMKQFGITSEQAYSLLAQGAQNGLDKAGDLADSANEYSVYFKQMGFSAEEMFDIFGAGMEAGAFNLDKVGDAIKELGIRTKDGSNATLDAYKIIGVNGKAMTQAFARGGEDAQEAFKTIVKALESVKDPAQKNTAAVSLFGTQFEDLEKDVIKAMTTARSQYDMTKDTMDGIAAVKYSSVSEQLRGMGRQLMAGFVLPIQDALLPNLQSVSAWFENAIPKVKEFFSAIAAPAIADFAKGIKTAFSFELNFGIGSSAQGDTAKVFDTFKEMAEQAAPYLEEFRDGFKSIVDALVPLTVKLWTAVGTMGTKFIAFIAPIIKTVQASLWPVLSGIFNILAQTVIPKLSEAFSAVLPVFMSTAQKLMDTITAVFNWFAPILPAISALFQVAFPVIKTVVSYTIDTVKEVLKGLLTALGGVLDFITGVFTGNWELAWSGIVNTFGGIWSGLKALVAAPIRAVIDLVNQAIDSINSVSFDVPEWMGGGTFGVNIPHIPQLPEFANGGFTNQPSIFGEAGPEAAIPLNNKPRSHAILEKTNRLMGHDTAYTGAGPTIKMEIIVNAPATEEDGQRVGNGAFREWVRMYEQFQRQQRRTVFAR